MINWLKNIFKTKRILETDGEFYPQARVFFEWKFLDKYDDWKWINFKYKQHFACFSLEEAKEVIARHFPKKKPIKYHYV